ncbi:brachyury isoform X2 [Brachionus plicatilis]|uniref:Brachyury isoform X2 n=1 Tax=Brachionus plicatilis TaxID=10195 RepID=A0A3M7PMN6_BRAPC|nr:brachyury isoform X2 [Brachionus plicatilis]
MVMSKNETSSSYALKTMNNGIQIRLEDRDLWMRFFGKTNEMIVTRSGRNMFPVLKTSFAHLEPTAIYEVVVDFIQIDNHKWKYINGEWQQGTKPDPVQLKCEYKHPDSPNFGSHWMKDSVAFNKIKLTNKPPNKGQIQLNSLHKYEPRIIVYKLNSNMREKIAEASFSETQFIAVTAYQNEEITSLKIRFNPFAKAFLDVRERPDRDAADNDHFEFNVQQPMAPQQPQPAGQAALEPNWAYYAKQSGGGGPERVRSVHRSSPYSASHSYHQQYVKQFDETKARPINSSSPLSSSSSASSSSFNQFTSPTINQSLMLSNEFDWNQSNQAMHSLMNQTSPNQFQSQNLAYHNQLGYASSPNMYWQSNGYYNQGNNYANYALALAAVNNGYPKMNYSYSNYYENDYVKLSPNTSDVDSSVQQSSLPSDSGFDSPKVCMDKADLATSCTPSPKWA